jgi:hypothetical protein
MKTKISALDIKKELRIAAPKQGRISRNANFKIKKASKIDHPSLCAGGDVFDVIATV